MLRDWEAIERQVTDMYNHILLPVDLDSERSWAHALPDALSIASLSQAELTVMSVVPELSTIIAQAAKFSPFADANPRSWVENLFEVVGVKLEAFVAEHVPAGQPTKPVVRSGTIYKEILGVAKTWSCDPIIVGSHRPELRDYVMGPNAAKVVRHADCSVLVIRK